MSKHEKILSSDTLLTLHDLFELSVDGESLHVLETSGFQRTHHDLPGRAKLVVDTFPDIGGTSCCFIRMPAGRARVVNFLASGIGRVESCPSGGWVLKATDTAFPSYWIPQPPQARMLDPQQRILSEKATSITGFSIFDGELSAVLEIPENMNVDWTIWRFPAESNIDAALDRVLVLERQPLYLWNSQTCYQSLADVYLYLIHGHVYVDRFIWPRMWKICSELDAYSLYVIMCGLELATGKIIYTLLKRQLLFSVIERQAADGGWYHGEWTDQMESHYRFHNGAMLLLEAALKERADAVVRKALERAAHFISRRTDKTDLGLWFLHDSLEDSAEMMDELYRQTGYFSWIPSRTFGKSPTNNLVLNTHLDAIVVLDQYRVVTGDNQYTEEVNSARTAARSMLALRPAEALYRAVYRAIQLTLLPTPVAEKLPLPVRAVKRLTWKYLTPRLHRIQRIFPRLVMPGGLIERHMSMPHFNITYHPVNIMDLTRLWRCFPDEDLAGILQDAIKAVTGSNLPEFWAEAKQRYFSLVVWVDALYHLCTLREDPSYRRFLAEGIINIEDTGLGLPPSLLGADPEAVIIKQRIPCPSPTDKHLRVVNLSCNGRREILVVNSTEIDRKLSWEGNMNLSLSWRTADDHPALADDSTLCIQSRNWAWGR